MPMLTCTRVEWEELRTDGRREPERYFMIAEWEGNGIRFFEKSSWDIRWIEIRPTEALRTMAINLLSQKESDCFLSRGYSE